MEMLKIKSETDYDLLGVKNFVHRVDWTKPKNI